MLTIKNLHVEIEGKPIIKGLNLQINKGEIHAIMGPNGAGKSTLSRVLAGDPNYEVTEGEILFEGEDLLELEVDERSQKGLFLSFQYPVEIPGVTNAEFLRIAVNLRKELSEEAFNKLLDEKMKLMDVNPELKDRNINEGFSGGEKKRNEILQMAMLEPKLAILDETDSGLDIDALRIVADGVNQVMNDDMGLLLITHYQRLLDYIKPHFVHVMVDGVIVQSGDAALALELESKGYKR